MKSVYLAGPISGLDYAGAQGWRDRAGALLAARGIVGLSPLRAKQYLAAAGPLAVDGYAQPLSTAKGLTTRDRMDCTRSDLVIANLLGADRVSVGTMIELGWADGARNPIVLVMEKEGNVHEHAMVRELAGFVVDTVDQACDLAVAILTGGEVRGVR